MLFFHFEPRAYHLTEDVIKDSINYYISKHYEYLYDPEALKRRMNEDFSFAIDQVAQKKIFKILEKFKQEIKRREEFQNIDLSLKVHFILWDEAFAFLQQEAKNPTFSISQIAHAFLGGVAEYNNIVTLDQFTKHIHPENIFNETCLKSCRIESKGDLLALPFWASMRTLFIRKDMLNTCPGFENDTVFDDWDSFEKAGKHFNAHLGDLAKNGFPNVKSFWAINISDKDMNTLQTLTPAIYSFGGLILKDRFLWKEIVINENNALNGIKKFFNVAKSVGSLEECTFGELLNRFHAGHFAVVMCGTWEHLYWRGTKPDSSSYIQIKFPPRGPEGLATLQWGCNLIIFKQKGKKDYNLEYELIHYLATDPSVQHQYVPSNSRLSVLKSVQDSLSHPEYYKWLNDSRIARTYPNNKEMFKLIDALTQKYHLASILQNVKGAPELSNDVWKVIENGINTTAFELNKQVIPKYIFYVFYSKINLIFLLLIFSLLSILFVQIIKRVRRSDDEKIIELLAKLKSITDEKSALEKKEQSARNKLKENQELIKTLNGKLEKVTKEFEQFKTNTTLEKIEYYTSQINELTSINNILHTELEKTTQKINENDRVVEQLEKELDEFKQPEIYIDFRDKVIRKKDGSEFSLSSAANQYKNDVFKYLEYIVRHPKKRIHLLEFGFINSKFFQKALHDGKVREYNYRGKFPKVRSGINRTFKNNIGKDLIIQDKTKIYVYFKQPNTIYQINTKEKDLDIALTDFHESKNPEVITFFSYETFDYYQINNQIIINSNIQDSSACYEAALTLNDPDERISKLEEALELDDKNYDALLLIMDSLAFNDIGTIQSAQQQIQSEINTLEEFLDNDLNYHKSITNIRRIKQEYREFYSWKYVNAIKSEKFTEIGDIAFGEIIKYEKENLKNLLDQRKGIYSSIQKYFIKLDNLKKLGQYFQAFINKEFLMEWIIDFIKQDDTINLFRRDENLNENNMKKSFIKYLVSKFEKDMVFESNNQLIDDTYNLLEWLQDKENTDNKMTADNLMEFFQKFEIEENHRNQIKQFCSKLRNVNVS